MKPHLDAVQAWVKWTNERGGVNGRPVTLYAADDAGDPARHRALVQEMVERRSVMAFVQNNAALTGQASVDYLTSKGIPVIGSEGAQEFFNTNPNYFPQMTSGSTLYLGMLGATSHLMVPEGKTKLGIVTCAEAQACRDGEKLWSEQAAAYGLEVVYKAKVSFAQPDFTAECLAARSAGAQVIIMGQPADGVRRLVASCARQGVKFTYSLPSPAVQTSMAEDHNFDNSAFVGFPAFPWTERTTPATAEFRDVITRYLKVEPSGGHAVGWVSAKLFEKVASTVTGPASTQGLLEGLWTIKIDTIEGLTAPLTFAKEKAATMPVCWFEMIIKDSRWVALNPHAPRCR